VVQDWDLTTSVREWLGDHVGWDEARQQWTMLRHFTESPHVFITQRGIDVLEQ
jgi:hypothetical protein